MFKSHEPVKLLKQKSYPTYQLYAEVNTSKTDPYTALLIVILETMSWLRKRFRDLEIPDEIKFPEPENYSLVTFNDISSFRINRGYVLEVVFLKEYGTWALHLAEPDLGPNPGEIIQDRNPVPGRIFETNIAFRIIGNKLECGFKTICSEPETSTVPCEVFRPAVVKAIVRNQLLGLRQIYNIVEEAHRIENISRIKDLKEFIKNKDRQLPIVIMAQYKEKANSDILLSVHEISNITPNYREIPLSQAYVKNMEIKQSSPVLAIESDKLIKYKMSFAQFFILDYELIEEFNRIMGSGDSISGGDIHIIYPVHHEKTNKSYRYEDILRDKIEFEKKLYYEIQDYPKGKIITFGNIKWLNEARILEQQRIIDMTNSKEEYIKAEREKLLAIEKKYQYEIARHIDMINHLNNKIKRLEEEVTRVKFNEELCKEEINGLKKKHSIELKNHKAENYRMEQLLNRPLRPDGIPFWVSKYFANRLLFHKRAISEINRAKLDLDMELLCNSLEYLANEYYFKTFGELTEEEHNRLCSEKYNRGFEVTPSGDLAIRTYAKEYKITYGKRPNGKKREVLLDKHLKVGKGNENIIRIYFYTDKEKKLIVVGSLPEHLRIN